ncbi:MAG TPA: cation:dicarboxylase symporter family transporter [Terriglobales bacterium]|jgi:Na+/H+-dicarboxylate symporter/ABC-type amino acid transport substrate-binding protein
MGSFTRQILIGLGLGTAAGLFLGEKAGLFQYGVDGFIRLLQMTVLPYVTVSLVAGIGSLNAEKVKVLFTRVGALTLVLWALALGAVFLMPLAFPHVQNASFFSTTLVEEPPPFDFVSLYIPSNPFYSLANNVVPAVVLFSSFLGIALMGIERKDRLIEVLLTLERALAKANRFVVRLTPFGLFCIAAYTVGTVNPEQLAKVGVYLISYGSMALLLTFWILPGFVACVTPIPVRRVLATTRDGLITAFMTGDLFIVLPILIDHSKELLSQYEFDQPEESSYPDVIVPAFYNLPHAAKMLTLSFVLFAAWYSETLLRLSDYVVLALAGVVSLMGSVNVAIPFLLDLVHVPADTYQLFLATGLLNSRFGTLTSSMYMITLAVAGTYALAGKLELSFSRILRYILITLGVTAVTMLALTVSLRILGAGTYDRDRMAMAMKLLHPSEVATVVLKEIPAQADQLPKKHSSVLDAAKARGSLRVGFIIAPPYSFFNDRGDLVGFDVEMANVLARELSLGLEFVPIPRDQVPQVLDDDLCDLIVGGIVLTTDRARRMAFSRPYMDETLAFVVPDSRRVEFSSAETIRKSMGLRILVPDIPYYSQLLQREFPGITIVPTKNWEDYFKGQDSSVDAMAFPAERGSFLTLLYPAFSVAVPHPLSVRIPLAYPVARHDEEFARFLGSWLDLKQKDGTIQSLYDHWILGRDVKPPRHRWSVLANVLHWTK